MERKLGNTILLAGAALAFENLHAAPPSTDERYFKLRSIMKEYVQGVVQEECAEQPGFDFNAYRWDDFEIAALELVLFDILNHTEHYCKPPELTGLHKGDNKVEH